MAIGHITPEALKKMRLHGHPDFWEIAIYGGDDNPDSVTVECTKCGEVLVELVNQEQEDDAVYCQNCDWEGYQTECEEITDLAQRVDPGEPMPAGECPRCGSLCQLKESDDA